MLKDRDSFTIGSELAAIGEVAGKQASCENQDARLSKAIAIFLDGTIQILTNQPRCTRTASIRIGLLQFY